MPQYGFPSSVVAWLRVLPQIFLQDYLCAVSLVHVLIKLPPKSDRELQSTTVGQISRE